MLERGDVTGAEELHAAYPRRATTTCTPTSHASLDYTGAAGVPIALKDVIGTKGVETTAGSQILRATSPSTTRPSPRASRTRGCSLLGKTNTDEFAMGSSTENSAFGPSLNPWDPTRVPGGSGGGSAAAVVRGSRAVGARLRHGRLDQAARRALRNRRPAPDVRHRLALRHRRVRVVARPGRADGEDRARRGAPLQDHRRARPVRLDDRRRAAGRAPDRRGPARRPRRRAEGAQRGGRHRAGRHATPSRRAIDLCSELGAEVEECSLPRSVEYGLPCYYLIAPAEASSNLARYDGVRYGFRADVAATTSPSCTSARATRASATSRSAASCSARTRSRRATTTRITARRRRCGR